MKHPVDNMHKDRKIVQNANINVFVKINMNEKLLTAYDARRTDVSGGQYVSSVRTESLTCKKNNRYGSKSKQDIL